MRGRLHLAAAAAAGVAAVFAGCRGVALPAERFLRLEVPPLARETAPLAGVLRVHDLQLATSFDGDSLVVADGVRLAPRPGERWCAPVDRLVTDALVLALSRAEVCTLVKGGADPGTETWSLHGRVVEFAECAGAGGATARAALELWVEAGDVVLLRGEFTAAVPLAERTADAAAAGLGRALHEVAARLATRLRASCAPAAGTAADAPTAPR